MALNGVKEGADRTKQTGEEDRMTYKEQGERSFRFRRSTNHVTCKPSATVAAADCAADNINTHTPQSELGLRQQCGGM